MIKLQVLMFQAIIEGQNCLLFELLQAEQVHPFTDLLQAKIT